MHQFNLWAPDAGAIEVVAGDKTQAMTRVSAGWWTASVDGAGPGTEYGFRIDGQGPVLPDPRSPYQPHGVHGRSCVVDHSAFRWMDHHWQARPLASAVIYEMHIGTFTPEGTLDSAIGRLDHLVDLGVTHVELMPVNEFSGVWGWGYDGVDLYAVHHAYGGPDALKRFVSAAHRKGLAVLLDVVYNHLGPAGNYLARFGPYFTPKHRTPWGDAVNLDGPHSHEVRRFFIDNALMWLRDYHFDGLRIDAVHALLDSGATHFLEELALEVERLSTALGRHLVLIAESDLNDPRVVRPREMGGYGINAQWSDDFHHALHSVLTGETAGYYCDFGRLEQLARVFSHVFVFDGCYSTHRQRPHGRPVGLLPGHHFLAYIQNHDQVGNRAEGRRISHLTSFRRAKIAAGLVLTSPFVPMLFQGEEWSASSPFQYFTRHEDTELGRLVSEGRRREFVQFGWKPEKVPDPQDPETFERSKLKWDELATHPHSEMLDWYRALIRLRRSLPALTDADLDRLHTRCDEESQWLAIERGPVTIACNLSFEAQTIPIRPAANVIIASTDDIDLKEYEMRLGAETLAVLEHSQSR